MNLSSVIFFHFLIMYIMQLSLLLILLLFLMLSIVLIGTKYSLLRTTQIIGNFKMLAILLVLLLSSMRTSTSKDSLGIGESIRDGDTLVSAGGNFELGFFSPGAGTRTTRRYLGIWYRDASGNYPVAWVANRERPLQNISGVLKFNENGILQILNDTNRTTIWSSNISGKASNNSILQLLDSGNLIVKEDNSSSMQGNILWQSFDHPSDVNMPGIKLGFNFVTGMERNVSSWKSEDDPAVGEYCLKLDPRGYPQLVILQGSRIMVRIGSWNGVNLTGFVYHKVDKYKLDFVLNDRETYFVGKILDKSLFSMYRRNPSGTVQFITWTSKTRKQVTNSLWEGIKQPCESYAYCGFNSMCIVADVALPTCECLKGYVPKFPQQWNLGHFSDGCVRKTESYCNSTDGFLKHTNMKLPDTSSSWFSKTMNRDKCQKTCLKNCSCTAYADLDIRNGGSGCLLWFDHLNDVMKYNVFGQDIYIRFSASDLVDIAVNGHGNIKKKKEEIIAVSVIIFGLLTCAIIMIVMFKSRDSSVAAGKVCNGKDIKEDVDLPTFDFLVLAKATENFSSNNKLGEGGFGSVFKGTLIDGQVLAVKRLSKNSQQGLEEFKNEVVLITKLQHRNLVKLLGCCIHGEEKVLVYEYMPNKSLEKFVSDESGRRLLDWRNRSNIISGIARGLLYLHQDSRLRIIHRDLKTSNILLDANLNPKISDFGLARSFLGDQVEENTNRVVGTYGYMSPEYAVHGRFSVKSDVFSYGVIVLELISGRKNKEFSNPENSLNLLGHAWRLWTDGRPLELLDEVITEEQYDLSEVIRCIQVGLLCVQQRPEDRPEMSSVVLMLNGEKVLPQPKVPGFYTERGGTLEPDPLLAGCVQFSTNEISVTMLEGR